MSKLNLKLIKNKIFKDNKHVLMSEDQIAFAYDTFINVFLSSEDRIYNYVTNMLMDKFGYASPIKHGIGFTRNYFFAGTMPVCLCAHTDTVYKNAKRTACAKLQSIVIDVDKTGKHAISSGMYGVGIGADDRLGICMILNVINELHKANKPLPSVLFCSGEETGCRGSSDFVKNFIEFPVDVNCFVQLDRKGNKDVVCYSDENPELTEAFEKYGFERNIGSWTDIRELMPAYGISGVNLSCGYYNEHNSRLECFVVEDSINVCKMLLAFLNSEDVNKKYVYKEEVIPYSNFSYGYSYGYLSNYKGYKSYKDVPTKKEKPKGFNNKKLCRHCKQPLDFGECNVVRKDNFGKVYVEKVCDYCANDILADEPVDFCQYCIGYTLIEPGISKCPICGNMVIKEDDLPF